MTQQVEIVNADAQNVELKTVWVFECVHDMYSGIHKTIVSGPFPSVQEMEQNWLFTKADETSINQEQVLFIDGKPHFLHV